MEPGAKVENCVLAVGCGRDFCKSSSFAQTCVRSSHWRCSVKSVKLHRKTPGLESLFNKVAGLMPF